jgi:hypothetical protein
MNEFLQRLKERKLVQLEIRLVLATLRPPALARGAPLSDSGRNGLSVVKDAEQQARAQLESIVAMVRAVNDAPSDEEREAALTAIYEDPLDVEVRGNCDRTHLFEPLRSLPMVTIGCVPFTPTTRML